MLPFANIILNITVALLSGIAIDRIYTSLRRRHITAHMRIVMQFVTLIGAVYAIDYVFQALKIESVSQSAFFISVFLSVQSRMFRDIETEAEKW